MGFREGKVIRGYLNQISLLCIVHHILLNRWSHILKKTSPKFEWKGVIQL